MQKVLSRYLKIEVEQKFLIGLLLVSVLPFVYTHFRTNSGELDFSPTLIAAKLILTESDPTIIYKNEPYGAYRPPEWITTAREFLPHGVFETLYLYPPLYLLPFILLVYLFNYITIVHIYFFILISLFVYLMEKIIDGLTAPLLLKVFLIALASAMNPVTMSIHMGQNVLVAALFLYLFLKSYTEKRNTFAVIFFCVMILCKLWLLVFLAFPFLLRDYRMTIYLTASIVILFFLQWLAFPDLVQAYFHLLGKFSKIFYVPTVNYSFVVALERFHIETWEKYLSLKAHYHLYTRVIQLIFVFLTLLIAWVVPKVRTKVFALLLVSFILSSAYWGHYLVFFVPFVYFPFCESYKKRQWLYFSFFLVILALIFFPDYGCYAILIAKFLGKNATEARIARIFQYWMLLPFLSLWLSFLLDARMGGLSFRLIKRNLLRFM